MTVRVAHFLLITYVRLLQKFEILARKFIMHIYPRRFRLNQRTQDKAEAEGPEQSADIAKKSHSIVAKRLSVLVLPLPFPAEQSDSSGQELLLITCTQATAVPNTHIRQSRWIGWIFKVVTADQFSNDGCSSLPR